jgi:predicted transcriptional regulator
VQKAVVYRAVQRLEQLGLITASGKQPSAVGPARALLQAQHERLAPVADGLAG